MLAGHIVVIVYGHNAIYVKRGLNANSIKFPIPNCTEVTTIVLNFSFILKLLITAIYIPQHVKNSSLNVVSCEWKPAGATFYRSH